jgi:hypothetical protein
VVEQKRREKVRALARRRLQRILRAGVVVWWRIAVIFLPSCWAQGHGAVRSLDVIRLADQGAVGGSAGPLAEHRRCRRSQPHDEHSVAVRHRLPHTARRSGARPPASFVPFVTAVRASFSPRHPSMPILLLFLSPHPRPLLPPAATYAASFWALRAFSHSTGRQLTATARNQLRQTTATAAVSCLARPLFRL